MRSVALNTLSGIALIRKESVGRKACETLRRGGMELYVKCEVFACRNMNVKPKQTDGHRQTDSRQTDTDRQTLPQYIKM